MFLLMSAFMLLSTKQEETELRGWHFAQLRVQYGRTRCEMLMGRRLGVTIAWLPKPGALAPGRASFENLTNLLRNGRREGSVMDPLDPSSLSLDNT